MTAVNWMPKFYKSKDSNPYDPDILISTQHTDRKGFSCTLSQENIPANIPIFYKHKSLNLGRNPQEKT